MSVVGSFWDGLNDTHFLASMPLLFSCWVWGRPNTYTSWLIYSNSMWDVPAGSQEDSGFYLAQPLALPLAPLKETDSQALRALWEAGELRNASGHQDSVGQPSTKAHSWMWTEALFHSLGLRWQQYSEAHQERNPWTEKPWALLFLTKRSCEVRRFGHWKLLNIGVILLLQP